MTPTKLLADILQDHDEIAGLIGSLRAALEGGDDRQARELLVSLEATEVRHYAVEAALIRAVAYDQADSHLGEHAAMLETLARINQVLALENAASIHPQIVAHLEMALAHMRNADEKLSRFVHERTVRS
jgi:hemerythrin